MKATDHLIQEHKVILRALDVLDALAASVETEATVNTEDSDKILDFLRWFADAHHQAKEESILFPAMRAHASENQSVQHMMFEHDQERQSIEDLETDLRLGNLSDFVSHANRLGSTLRNHIYKEDQLLFPAADEMLSPQEDETVAQELNRFETALDKQTLDQKLHDLHSLEWKYLRK